MDILTFLFWLFCIVAGVYLTVFLVALLVSLIISIKAIKEMKNW